MKKTFTLLFIAFCCTGLGLAQVGIGTLNPQEDLHVAGSTSTIRIEKLNATNSPLYNDGVNLAPVYVDGNGDLVLGNGTGSSGQVPLNFLIDVTNFIPDDPYGVGGSGTVLNNDTSNSSVSGQLTSVAITVPQDAIAEVKYGVSLIISGTDISTGSLSYITYDEAIMVETNFVVDIDSDGLSATELAKVYGRKGQYYETNYGGSIGYPYMNGQAYLTLPAGNHTLYFYGIVKDQTTSYTSVGFGGATDYLKIRIYN